MGAAHSLVINKTHKKICVITFNLSDILYQCKYLFRDCKIFPVKFPSLSVSYSFFLQLAYQNMYVLMPGESKQIEAQADPYGLKGDHYSHINADYSTSNLFVPV